MDKDSARLQIAALVEKYNEVSKEKDAYRKYNEEDTKAHFISPLFQALGWDIQNSNRKGEVTFENKISKGRVDYGFRLNGIPKFFLEAKALKENIENSNFILQAINYSWHKGCTWAVLSDFETIKIFNAEWRENDYSQSHLKTIYVHEFLDRFNELWLLSKESFENGLLDKEAEKWGKKTKKTPVDKQLLSDFTRFREMLSRNISKLNHEKKISQEDLNESIQRILDRMIFIRYCEDKGLEERKLISNLREWESRKKGQLVNSIRNVYSYFDNLYNSKIFASHLCDDLEISNEVLIEIIEGLHFTKDRTISYDFSAIEADVLGNIYEQYLGYVLRKTERRATLTASQIYRKEQGIFYTPTSIVDFIVRSTLGNILEDKKVKPANIRILDPACGSGSFLIKAFDIINEYYVKHDKNYEQTMLDTTNVAEGGNVTYTKKLKILQENIFGVDLDKQAVEIAQLNLLLKIAEKRQRLPLLQQNIKRGNSLIGTSFNPDDRAFNWQDEWSEIMEGENGGFDIVIGNPPYGAEISEAQKEFIKKHFKSATGRYDSYYYFIERGISLLKDGGMLGFIVPDTWLTNYQTQSLRDLVLSTCRIIRIVSLPQKVFLDANVDTCIVILKKESNEEARRKNKVAVALLGKDVNLRNLLQNIFESEFLVIQKDWLRDKRHLFNIYQKSSNNSLIEKIKKDSKPLGKISEMTRGINPYAKSELIKKFGKVKGTQIVKNRIWHSDTKKGAEYKKELVGSDIGRYSLHWKSGKWIKYGEWLSRPRDPKFFTLPHLVVQRIRNPKLKTRIVAAFIDPKHEYYNNSGLTNIIIVDKAYSIKYVLALLNSKLINWYYRQFFRDVNIKPEDLRELPIKKLDFDGQKLFSDQVDKMLSLNEKLAEYGSRRTDERSTIEDKIKKLDGEIDRSIYRLYNIAPEEEKVIEESFK